MRYETAAQMAKRLNVNMRTVQIWAKDGKLPGAIKQGRDWLIPEGQPKPDKNVPINRAYDYVPLHLMNSAFTPGMAKEFIKEIEDDTLKNLALAEYYYFTGQAEDAVKQTELFFNHEDIVIKLSACLLYTFANLPLGNIHLTRMALGCIKESMDAEWDDSMTPERKAICVFIQTAAGVLFHLHPPVDKLMEHMKYLPTGLKLWACFVLSHDAYLKEDYNKALGIIETAFSLHRGIYPISSFYLHLSAAMNLMAIRRVDDAKKHFYEAWGLAKPDGFLEVFAEHHGLLCGLIETCLKHDWPEEYEKIIAITYNFSEGWRKIHNKDMQREVACNLSTTEFAISMLANRGWSNQEIADYMRLSLHTVKRYISIVYQKLGITNRGELKRYMLQ